jgi:hypothetical protein
VNRDAATRRVIPAQNAAPAGEASGSGSASILFQQANQDRGTIRRIQGTHRLQDTANP